mgnify:CR=1 FL=1|jgi:type IV secretion system protein VirD4
MSKQKKYKIILGILIFVLGTIASIYFTVYLDALFSHKDINIYIFKIERIKNFFKNDIRTLKLFFLLELLVILISIFFLLKNDRFYESSMIEVTPQIKIPAPAGQKQFGSARFMSEDEKDIFGVIYIKRDKIIKNLINHGYDDISHLKRGDRNF